MKINSSDFFGVKARLQRLNDCSLFEGWVSSISDTQLVVRMRSEKAFGNQDRFFCELIGNNHTLQLCAQYAGAEDVDIMSSIICASAGNTAFSLFEAQELDYEFSIVQLQRLCKTTEPFRRKVDELGATLDHLGQIVEIEILDAGVKGIGALVPFSLEVGSDTKLTLTLMTGTVKLDAVVRRCFKPRIDNERYQVGLEVKPSSRIDQALWNKFVGLSSAA